MIRRVKHRIQRVKCRIHRVKYRIQRVKHRIHFITENLYYKFRLWRNVKVCRLWSLVNRKLSKLHVYIVKLCQVRPLWMAANMVGNFIVIQYLYTSV